MTQPAVSKHVRALELEVGERLVTRARTGASLTAAREIVAEYVLRAEALLANASRALVSGAEEAGVLALAASGIPRTYLLPPVVARLRNRHPRLVVDFPVGTSARALELLRMHQVEVAVVGGMTIPDELEAEELADDEILLVAAPELAARRLRARDLERLTWISREEGSATRAAVETARWEIGLHEVRTFELSDWEAVKVAVAAGEGIAAISRFAVEHELAAGTLVRLDVPRWRLTRTISIVTARGVPLTPPAELLVEELRGAVRGRAAPTA